jgi:hypothetical protein
MAGRTLALDTDQGVGRSGMLATWTGEAARPSPGSEPGALDGLRFAFYGRVSTEDHQDPETSPGSQLLRTSPAVDADGIAAAVVRVTVPAGEAVDEGEASRGAAVVVLWQGDAGRHREVGLVQAEAGDDQTARAQGRARQWLDEDAAKVGGQDRIGSGQRPGTITEEATKLKLSRSGAGSIPRARRISHTVDRATLMPSTASSP